MLKILVPLDGSVESESALPFAEALARAAGATIVLVRAASSREDAAELDAVSSRLAGEGLQVQEEVDNDDPAAAIVSAVDRSHADLIVMRTHAREGVDRILHGSVADQVVRTSAVPVLVVPPDARYRLIPPCTVIVPLDGSQLAERALKPALDLAEALGAGLRIVRVTDSPDYWVVGEEGAAREPSPGSEAARAARYLDAVADRYARPTVQIARYVTDGDPAEVIAALGAEPEAAAIGMATHGRSGLSRAMAGSVAAQLLASASLPVLLVHPHEPSAA
jgi:nucleotide-binding universal stress UspA family protein